MIGFTLSYRPKSGLKPNLRARASELLKDLTPSVQVAW